MKEDLMVFFEQYLNRADEIFGDHTKDEIRYDNKILRWLRKGKDIRKAMKKANEKYPKVPRPLLPRLHS